MNLVPIFNLITPGAPGFDDVDSYFWNKTTRVVDLVSSSETTGSVDDVDLATTVIVDQYFDGTDFVRIFHSTGGFVSTNIIAAPNVYASNQSNLAIALPINQTPYYDITNKGSVDVRSVGGVAPITFDLDGGTSQSTGVFTGLSAGTYTITATDANGFTDSVDVTIDTFIPFGTWKSISFVDYLGRDVQLAIQRQAYSGAVTELCYAGTPVELTQENLGSETNGIIVHTAQLNCIDTTDGEFNDIVNSDSGEFCLKIKITDPSTVYEMYLEYDPENVTIQHRDSNKIVSLQFKTDILDNEETIENFSGLISPIKLLSYFFVPKDTFKKTFYAFTSLREDDDAAGYLYQTVGKYFFDASLCNGLTQREVIDMIANTFQLSIVSGASHYIYQSDLIYTDRSVTGSTYTNLGEYSASASWAVDLRTIVNPTAGTLNYINNNQQYRFNKQLKSVEATHTLVNHQTLTELSPLWVDSTLSNYVNPSSLAILKLKDSDGNKINDGVQIPGVTSYVKDASFIKSEPYYLSDGGSTIQVEISVTVPGATAASDSSITCEFNAQILYGNNSMTDATTFDLSMGAFISKEISSVNSEVKLKAKNTLPSEANYITVVLYQLQSNPGGGDYPPTKVNVNSVKVEILPGDNYYEDEITYTEDVNPKGVTESIDLKLADSYIVANAPYIFKGALIRDTLDRTASWIGANVTVAKPLIEAVSEIKSLYKSSKVRILTCTLIDDPPKWNTTYTDPTLAGYYFRPLPNWRYDVKTNQLECELIQLLITTTTTGNRLLESGDNRLLETADIRNLE